MVERAYVSGEGAIASRAPELYSPGAVRQGQTANEVYLQYAWLLALISQDDTGSLRGVFDWVIRRFDENKRRPVPLDVAFTEAELKTEIDKTAWKKQRDSLRAQAEIDRQRFPEDWQRSVEDRGMEIREIADQFGIQASDAEISAIAAEARLNGWDRLRIRRALEPLLDRTIAEGQGLVGQVGDAETDLMQWMARNGLQLARQDVAKFLSNVTLGRQSLEDVKADIRKTYLAGMYPAWADKINEGFDPEAIFAPYKSYASRLLEIEDIGLDDPIMKRITQAVGADGKPVQKPLWEFEQEIRKDPRWQQTDNAYATYTDVGTELLKMFGFR